MARAKRNKTTPRASDIRDRVIELRRVRASEVQEHPLNWRTHGNDQRSTMRDLLRELGYVKPVDVYTPRASDRLVREGKLRAGGPCILDGHLRREEVPSEFMLSLNVTDLSEDEALKYLATCDPLSGLAEQDDAKLLEVLAQVDSDSAAVQKMLSELVDVGGGEPGGEEVAGGGEAKYQILIECKDEEQQKELLEELLQRDINCRSLIA